jgi:hypothetical protein
MSLFMMLTAALVWSGVLLIGLTLLHRSRYGQERLVREGNHGSESAKHFGSNVAFNAVFSASVVYGLTYLLFPFLHHSEPVSP